MCFMMHRPAPSRNCSDFRTVQLGLCSRCWHAITASSALVAGPAADHRQVCTIHTKFGACPLQFTCTTVTERVCNRTLCSSAIPLLVKPFTGTDFFRGAFQFSAPSVWNSLPQTVLISDSVFLNPRIKTLLFTQALAEHWSNLLPLKLRLYGTKFDYCYYRIIIIIIIII